MSLIINKKVRNIVHKSLKKKKAFFTTLLVILVPIFNGCGIITATFESWNTLQQIYNPTGEVQTQDIPCPNPQGIDGTKLSVKPSKKGDPYKCWTCNGKGYTTDKLGKKHCCTYCNGRGWNIY